MESENHDWEIRVLYQYRGNFFFRLPDLIGNWNHHYIYYHALMRGPRFFAFTREWMPDTLTGLLNGCIHANRFSFPGLIVNQLTFPKV